METAIEVMGQIEATAKSCQAASLVHVKLAVGEWIRQGDIYIRRVNSTTARGEWRTAQLVEGTTVGARHVARAPALVYEPARLGGNVLVECDSPWCLAHPEHAHHCLPPGTYEVIRQQDLATQRAVRD